MSIAFSHIHDKIKLRKAKSTKKTTPNLKVIKKTHKIKMHRTIFSNH